MLEDFNMVKASCVAGIVGWCADADFRLLPVREPDLLIILQANRDRIRLNHVLDPADMGVEIVSPESAVRDRVDEVMEYAQAGVPEYWLVDPTLEQATIYRLGADGSYKAAGLHHEGYLISAVLPGFHLNPALLWQEEPRQKPLWLPWYKLWLGELPMI